MPVSILLLILIIALITIFSVQNAAPVSISFLFWKFEASLAVVIYLLVLLGVLLGVMLIYSLKLRASLKKNDGRKRNGV